MRKLLKGLHQFQTETFLSHQKLFERLSEGQNPDALFITCSDSRINPNLITHTEPGDLFILRNAGNIIPPYGSSDGCEAGTIEFAVTELKVHDLIVCGHSLCGAIKGLLKLSELDHMPSLQKWLGYAETTRRLVMDKYKDSGKDEETLRNIATQENVLVQLENLRTHPSVASGLASGTLNLHGWVYKIQTGEVFGFNPNLGQFEKLSDLSTSGAGGRFWLSDAASI